MTQSHTVGPWHIENYSIVDPQDATILVKGVAIPGGPESDSDVQQGRANARLIAAAPEMLELCKRVLRDSERGCLTIDTVQLITDTIAKAEGRA